MVTKSGLNQNCREPPFMEAALFLTQLLLLAPSSRLGADDASFYAVCSPICSQAMEEQKKKLERLRSRRRRLLQAYLIHVGWLTSTCAFAASDTMDLAITASLWMVLITVPPVLVYTVSVHKACRLTHTLRRRGRGFTFKGVQMFLKLAHCSVSAVC